MSPKTDIRSFFKPAGTKSKADDAGGGSKSKPFGNGVEKVEEPLRKKSKYFPDDKKADKQGHADQNLRPKSAQNAESPAKADKRTPKKASGNAAGKSANANKRKLVLDSDSDDDFEEMPIKIVRTDVRSSGRTPKKPKTSTKPTVKSDDDDDFKNVDSVESSDDESVMDLVDSDVDDEEEQPRKLGAGRGAKRGKKQAPPLAKSPGKPPARARVVQSTTQTRAVKAPTPPKPQPATQVKPEKPAKAPAKPRAKKKGGEDLPADVEAAIQAVDAAAAKLPSEDALNYSVMAADGGGGWNQRASDKPPNPGSKVVPRGHPQCLTGKTFVITGVSESLERADIEDLIKRHNGRVTGSVSGKTSFLVVGTDCGSSKTRAAKEKGVKLIDEDGLLALIKAAPEPATSASPRAPEALAQAAPPLPSAVSQLAPAGRQAAGGASVRPPPQKAGPSSSSSSRPAQQPGAQLWVEKHKPHHMNELVGNKTVVQTLREWLESWDAIHLHGQPPPAPKGRGAKPKDYSKKAVLLSGPPGIGKTTSALLVSRGLGFLPVEVNASDTRNKSDSNTGAGINGKLANSIKELATNRAIGLGSDGKPKKICLVMDEVDGMSGGDRGGVSELILTIKRSKVPIIAICNDKYNQKLKSLKNHVMELDFRKPTALQVVPRLHAICANEGLQVADSTLQSLAEGANCDIRLILGQLQMIKLKCNRLEYDDVKKGGNLATVKDAEMSPFEAARVLLSPDSQKLSMGDRMDLVFQDADLVPLLVQENYLNHRPMMARDDSQRLRLMAKAADLISQGDVLNRAVRQRQNWSLSPAAVVIGSVAPAAFMRGNRETFGLYPGEMNFPRFPAWLGQNSSAGKQRRLLGALHTKMTASGNMHADRTGLRISYLPAFRPALTTPLLREGKEGIPDIIALLHEYCMVRDDVDFVLDITKFKSKAAWAADPFKEVPTLVKSAFTRQVNQDKQAPKTTIMVDEFKKGKKKAAPAAEQDGDGDEEEEGGKSEEADAPQESEPEEENIADPLVAAKRAKQLAKHGIVFQAKVDPKAQKGRGKAPAAKGSAGSKRGGSGRGRGR